jgi:putative transposase
MIIEMALESCGEHGITDACRAFGVSRATVYRRLTPKPANESKQKKSHRRLGNEEEEMVLDTLACERYLDESIPEIYASLLDEGCYLCSQRTMYRILQRHGGVKERRNLLHHPEYTKPELLAERPNEVWSWDITKLKGPTKWSYVYLYVIMDIYSRCVVGWMVASRESAMLAEKLILQTCETQSIQRNQLTIHADRGTSMKSKLVAQLLADLAITKSHSRPHTSNDNPYSEAQFKTLKYHHSFPKTFGCLEDAQTFLRGFFEWYNRCHKHSGIGYVTPESLHTGQAQHIREERSKVLRTAYDNHPERFVKGIPVPPVIPTAAWINKPKDLAA